MEQQLEDYFQRYAKLTTADLESISSRLTLNKFSKKAYLLEQDQTCKHNYFILQGLVRLFYIDPKGHEQITQFAIENWWVTSLESFINGTPSYIAIQAVEDSSVYALHKTDLEELYETIPSLNKIFRRVYENMLIASQRRSDLYIKLSSRDRYYHFVTHQPDFAQRVPQYMIASYLEITPEYLSELRRKK